MKFFIVTFLLLYSSYVAFSKPVITSFSPASGQVGSTITIAGLNFSTVVNNNIVFFGAVRATVTSATTTSLNVTVPVGATFQPLTVTVNGLTDYSAKPFIVTFSGGGNINTTSFANKVDFNTDLHPYEIAVTDLDGDGKPDIATSNNYSTTGLPASISTLRNVSTVDSILFAPKKDFDNGVATYAIAAGDLDGDGKPDLVASSISDQNISVFRNTSAPGTINFASKVDYASGSSPYSIGISDVDGDGKPDIVVVNATSNTISVYRNTGNIGVISFAPKIDFTTALFPQRLVMGDFDDDGKRDIAITNQLSYSFSIFRNTSSAGNISFAAKLDITCGSGNEPVGLTIADFNDDQKQDLAIVISKTSSGSNSFSQVFRNTSTVGNISFSYGTGVTGSSNGNTYLATAGDINGDGKPDLALSVTGQYQAVVFENACSGNFFSFLSGKPFNTLAPYAVALGDFDGDSKPDLITSSFNSNTVSVFKNRCGLPGITSFTPTNSGTGATITINGNAFDNTSSVTFGGVAAASFNVVNSTKITAIIGTGASGNVQVTTPAGMVSLAGFIYFPPPTISGFSPLSGNTGTAITITGTNFSSTTSISFGGVAASSFTVVNSTTITAIVANGASGNVLVTTSGGSVSGGGFTYIPPVPPPKVNSFTPVTGANGTIVTISGTNLMNATSVKFGGSPAASFTVVSSTTISAQMIGGSSGYVVVITPVGRDSLGGFIYNAPPVPVINSFTPFSGPPGTTVTITGNNFNTSPAGNIVYFGAVRANVLSATATQLTANIPFSATYGLVSVTNNYLTAYSTRPFVVTFPGEGNISANSFQGPLPFPAGKTYTDVSANDFDGDGKVDLAAADQVNKIAVFRNTSTGGNISFANQIEYAGRTYSAILSADIDGNGMKDIIGVSFIDKGISVYKNLSSPGNINFAPEINYTLNVSPTCLAIADFDGDGKADIIIGNGGTVSVFRNTSILNYISFAPRIDITIPGSNASLNTGDFDNDNKPDLVVLNSSYKSIYLLRNLSTTGNISFDIPISYPTKVDFPTSFGPTDVLVADFDDDSKPDVVVANTSASQSVSFFKNVSSLGAISFSPRTDLLTGSIQPFHLAINDLDGDGKPDITFSNYYPPRTMSVIKNSSSGGNINFTGQVDFADNTNGQLSGISTADLNGDGKPEIISTAGNSNALNSIYIYQNLVADAPTPGFCIGGDATLTANLTGTIYKWQQNSGSGFKNLANNATFSGVNTNALKITSLLSSWYGYTYRCLVNGVSSNVTTLRWANEWLGTSDSAWENAANWSCGSVPDSNTDVIINSGTVILNSNTTIKSLQLISGSSFTVGTGVKLIILH